MSAPPAGEAGPGAPQVTTAPRPPQPAGLPRRHRRRPPARRWTRLGGAAGTVVAAVALFACYLRQSRTVAVGSDGASQALQAWDLLHGNPLLHGWWVTDVSFYSTELPQYALLELARGLNADVIHVAGALTYTLLVLAAALLARGRTAGRAGLGRALLAAAIMLAPQLGPGTKTLVLSPDHTGTSIPVLLILLLIERVRPGDAGPRAVRWLVPLLTWLGLAATMLADAMTLFIAVIPLALVVAIRLACARAWRGWPAGPRAEAGLALAALLAVPAELAVARLIRAHGGWQVNGLRTALAGAGQVAGNLRLAGQGLLELFGADVFDGRGTAGTALAVLHLIGAALAAAGVLATARHCWRRALPDNGAFPAKGADPANRANRADLVEQVLLAGIVIDLAAYLAGVQAVDILSTREIAPVLPFAAVLAGRRLGPPLTAAAPVLRAALCAALALYAAGLGYAAAQPPAAAQYADLAGWLQQHQLTAGLSGYHQANIVTLESGGAVTLRAVTPGPAGRLTAYTWNASAAWYDPARRSARFLVLDAAEGPPTARQVVATFGRPARRYQYRGYVIWVWPRGDNLLAGLRSSQSAAVADPKNG